MNSTIDLLNKRVSLRKYADKSISPEHEAAIIQSAMKAPTAGNMMLYSIIVVKDVEKRKILSKTCDNQPFIAASPLIMIFVADFHKLYEYYRLSDVKEYAAQKGLHFTSPDHANLMLGISDALISAQNAVIAAESLGIGSCYIGDIMENYETHRALLKLPAHVFPIGMLTFGYYPKDFHQSPKGRFQKEYVVFHEEYQQLSDVQIQDMYKEWDRNFNKLNPFEAENAGQMHYARKIGAAFTIEMERSVCEAMKNWNGDTL